MARTEPRRPWSTREAQGATFVELFFDLVFVFAVTSITALVVDDLTWAGVGRAGLVLWLVWWAWTQFTWTLNPADTTHPVVRLLTLVATAAAFVMALAIPDAFAGAGPWFAVSYVGVRVVGLGLQVGVATPGTRTSVWRWVAWSSVGLVVVLVGGAVPVPGRTTLWALAVALDLLSASRAGRGPWALHPAHFAERHGLFVIIALGESLIAAGTALAGTSRDTTFAVGALAAVTGVSALWWLYFADASTRLEELLAATPDDARGRVARNVYSWGHLPVIAGIIAFAVGVEEVLAHPRDPLPTGGRLALAGGVALYLGGIAAGLAAAHEERLGWWAGAIVLAAVVTAATATVPAMASLGLVILVLLGLAAVEWRAHQAPAG